jgi:hypothetical protein
MISILDLVLSRCFSLYLDVLFHSRQVIIHMPEQDIKLLWGRAAERCSFPKCGIKLTQDKKLASGSFPLGEQAHMLELLNLHPEEGAI